MANLRRGRLIASVSREETFDPFAVAGQASPVAVARGEHPQAVYDAAAAGEPGHPGGQRLGADPELLQVSAELTRFLGRARGGLVTEQGRDRVSITSDSVVKKVRASWRMAVLVLVGNTSMATATPMTAPIAVSSIRKSSMP